MGEQSNLTEENVEALTKQLEKMQENNPELEYKFFEESKREEQITIADLDTKLQCLIDKIDRIFADYVLIKGDWVDVSNIEDTAGGI